MNKRRSTIIIGFILASLVLAWAGTKTVLAHAILVSADPAPNSVVNNAPEELWVQFSEPIEPAFSQIAIFSQAGQRVDEQGFVPANDDNTAMLVPLPELSNGTYLVSWRVLSNVDGHTTSGTFPFGIGEEISGGVGTVSSSAQQPTIFSTGGRWLTITGVALLLGLFSFYLFIWWPLVDSVELDPVEIQLDLSAEQRGLMVGWISLALLALGSIFVFLGQATQYDLLSSEFTRLWLATQFGSMWFIRMGLLLLFALLLLYLYRMRRQHGSHPRLIWGWWTGLGIAIGLALTLSFISHSAALTSDDATLALVVDFAHILSASVWSGGLLCLGLILWLMRSLPGDSRLWLSGGLALNFSTLAAGAVGILLFSGGYLAWQHIGSWTLLFGTAYGLTLLLKIGLALPAFGIAAINLLVVKPRLVAALDEDDDEKVTATSYSLAAKWPPRFTHLAQIEVVFALLVLMVAGYLTDLQRGLEAPLLVDEPGKVLFEQPVDDLNVILSLEPALVGQNKFEVFLQDEDGQPVEDASEVSFRFTFLGQSMGTATAEATHLGGGRYQVEGGYVSLIGPWQVEVAIRRPGSFDTFAPFRMEAGLRGTIRALGNQSNLERLTKFLTQSGGLVTSIALLISAIVWGFLAVRAAKQDWHLVPLLLPSFLAVWLGGTQLYTFYNEYTPTKFTTNPILPDSGSVARGQQLYEDNCVICHGIKGLGDGEAAAGLFPPPVNFTDGHTDTHPDGDIYFWIKEGIEGSAMPAFGEQFSDEDVWNLVNYIRRLSAQ